MIKNESRNDKFKRVYSEETIRPKKLKPDSRWKFRKSVDYTKPLDDEDDDYDQEEYPEPNR
jgi:hypothetical protein